MRSVSVLLSAALLGILCPVQAAHLYAGVPGGINVYEIAGNGLLTFRQTVATAPFVSMAITPGGRFLYTSGGNTITEYATQSDGTLRQQGAPLSPPHRAWVDMAMHPSGDFLLLVDRISVAGYIYRTDDADGHLTVLPNGFAMGGAEAQAVAADPNGEFIFGGSNHLCPPTRLAVTRIQSDGTVSGVGSFGTPSVTDRMAADSQFVYVSGITSYCSPGVAVFSIMRISANGSLSTASQYTDQVGPMQPFGSHFLALAKGASLYVYTINRNGLRTQTDQKPIETFAMAVGKTCWANTLWVATDDGIVTYSFDSLTGVLTRIGKTLVTGAQPLAFGIR